VAGRESASSRAGMTTLNNFSGAAFAGGVDGGFIKVSGKKITMRHAGSQDWRRNGKLTPPAGRET